MPGERIVCHWSTIIKCEFNHQLNMKLRIFHPIIKESQFNWLCLGDLSLSFLWTSLHRWTNCFAGGLFLKGKKEDGGRAAKHKQLFLHVRSAGRRLPEEKGHIISASPPPPPPPALWSCCCCHISCWAPHWPGTGTKTRYDPRVSRWKHTHKVLCSSTFGLDLSQQRHVEKYKCINT